MDIEKEINSLKNLPQYKDKSDEELKEIAQKRKLARELGCENVFVDDEEKKYAQDLYTKYLEEYSIESVSDINILKNLVYLEVLNQRFQGYMTKQQSSHEALHGKTIEDYHKNLEQILSLKEKLGLLRSEEESKENPLTKLKKRFDKYILEHRDEFTMTCPHCGKMTLIRRRTKDMENIKHPFFKGRTLYNKKVLELVRQGKITTQDASEILETSPYYIQWLLDKESQI